ncbi:transmembrane protein 223 [Phymastichus coffea]|uniref:transmembrane protein 223 n=1 Tax=Phymastichus coffea TaxID=108790 RepID=UPI00273BB865|nr:transmembrane protein 223 [Phymastichus coffea]XP_058807563.1 transmembrane protein 223 [Phymastichus coffea]
MLGIIVGVSRLHIRTTAIYESFRVAKIFKQSVFQEFSHWRIGLHKIETRNHSNWRTFGPKKWRTNHTHGQACCNRQILSTPCSIFQYFRSTTTNPTDFNIKVKNNVMLYRFEKPYMFKLATVFAVFAFVGCFAMADIVYKVLCKDLWNSEKALRTRLIEHLLPISAVITGVAGGPIIAGFITFLTIKSVKYIILRKGGQDITLVTYHPFKSEVVHTMPLIKVSSLTTRDGLKSYIPIKVKGYRYNFMCDKNGHFVNPELFDNTVGIQRFK